MAFHSDLTGKRVLITGASGFTGRYVVDRLAAAGCEVHDLRAERGGTQINLLDRAALSARVLEVAPQLVVHLAAISFVAHGDPEEIYSVNVAGTRNLLDSLARLPVTPSNVLLASSANVYGNASGVLDERAPLSPQNDYAVSKMAMEAMASLWRYALPLTVVRPFNYTGVGQTEKFLIPKIVSHFRRGQSVIELGNTDVSRDFYDVRCVAEAYFRLLALQGAGDTYNVCSGKEYSLDQIIGMMREVSGRDIEVRVNPSFVRANEIKSLRGDNTHLRSRVGELPAFDLKEMLRWMYKAGEQA
ncbi:NAD-dependent epimerase/dehydratase family protein [uncultured Pseudoxanthomonas sp.]|uniref:NAD-dependent epimerase/dehydratase family protein n=1 Tax=uncultured Pseudoxanthomonas sp. TaxID=281701 RepID=UPI002627A4DD|nr:NAD-dependent epimerase/dehydratase family protein [uncultured Pseudoxanthomonas sp.]